MNHVLSVAEERKKKGHDLWVNPKALSDTPQKLNAAFKAETFLAAVEAWQQTLSED